jgi:hypothetical protein
VINHIQQNYVGEHVGLCFAYFSFTDTTFQDLTLLIALFMKQIFHQGREIPTVLTKAKQEAKTSADVLDTTMFTHSTKPYHQMFIVIDGLDECSEEKRLPILDFIVEASSDQSSNIKIFLSSRKEPDISSRLKNLNAPAIELETGKVTPDIQNFVRHEAMKLRSESKLLVRDEALFAEIVQRLVEMSDGM